MFKILLIALICYMCFVVYKTKRDMLIEEKKKKQDRSSGTTCLLVSERKQAYWQEQERVTVPTKEITLEKDVANIYDLVVICSNECR